ncbi:MAG: zinc metallopeptidase [Epulopiscium sp.]|nr:zinc metallopeptidase [Candidatus Epulonipiscium sp.]
MYGIDMAYIVLVLPAMILAMFAQTKVKTTFNRYSRVGNISGYTGADVAKRIMNLAGVHDVRVERVRGNLTDHYDPTQKVLRLSDSVYDSKSVAAIGVAAHEVGHAIQHNTGYSFLRFRHAIFPVANIASRAAFPLIIIGSIFSAGQNVSVLLNLGIIFFAITVLFAIITLPVEFNASRRAMNILDAEGILVGDELNGASKVLKAAALTYVASAAVAIGQLLRLLVIFGGKRDD